MSHMSRRCPCRHRQTNIPEIAKTANIFLRASGPAAFHRSVHGTCPSSTSCSSVEFSQTRSSSAWLLDFDDPFMFLTSSLNTSTSCGVKQISVRYPRSSCKDVPDRILSSTSRSDWFPSSVVMSENRIGGSSSSLYKQGRHTLSIRQFGVV